MRKILFILLGLSLTFASFSQKGTIRGFVSDKNTGEPIMFCNVSLEGTNFGSQTDLNGMYTLSKIPPGVYNIIVTYVGYQKLSKSVDLKMGKIFIIIIALLIPDQVVGQSEKNQKRFELIASLLNVIAEVFSMEWHWLLKKEKLFYTKVTVFQIERKTNMSP